MAKKKRKPQPRRAHAPAPARPQPPPRLEPDLWVLALAAAGLLLTGYLTLAAWGEGAPALCPQGGGCDVIQGSRWSYLFGLPLALWGFGLYALVALVAATGSAPAGRWRRLSRLTLLGLAISVYLTVRRVTPPDNMKDLPRIFQTLSTHAERLAESRVIPHLITPLRETIASQRF